MAGKIVGITIDIAGKTSGLVSSLKSADSALSKTNSALKSVNNALKFDSSNVDLLKSKSQLLGEAIAANSEKLDVLKATAEKAMETLGQEGGTTTEQMAELQAEISRTEQTLAGLETEAANTNSALDSIGSDAAGELDDLAGSAEGAAGALGDIDSTAGNVTDRLGEIAKKCQETGEAINKNVSEPLQKLGKLSIDAFNEVDGGMDIIIKKTGATGGALDELEDVYENVFGSMPVSADQAGSAIGELNTRMGLTGQALEDTAKMFLQFSEITDSDVGSSVASVSKIMTKFGQDSSQTGNVLGLMAKASQQSGISVESLTGSLESNGAQLKEMGFDLTESVNLLSMLESNGVDASTAMTAFKKEVANATKEGQSAEDALNGMIDSIKNASSDTEALQRATELFGSKGAPEMTQAIREGRLSIEDLSGSLESYGTVVNDTFEATQDPPDKAKVAFNNLKLAGSELGSSILQTLTPAISGLTKVAQGLNQWFSNLDPTTQKVIVTVALLAATIGPLLIVVAKVITAVQTIMTILPALKGAIAAVNATLAANPIALVVAAIAALIAIFVTLWNNCEEFREFWIGLWEALQEGASVVIDGISTAFTQLGEGFQVVGDGIMLLFDSIGTTFSTLGDTLGTIAGTITDAFQTMADTVGGIFNGMWEVIKGVINTIIGGVNGMIAGIEGGLNAVIGALNTLHWEIPSWVPGLGGYGFGFDIPKASFGRIPELATGAVIKPNSPFLAVLGDQTQGTNIEAPLATIQQALIDALKSPQAAGASGGPSVINLYVGNEKFGTAVANANSRNAYISGGR